MDASQTNKLVTFIEENLRASPAAGLAFVDTRQHRTRLLSRQNHVVFGRRGAGKTSLVKSTGDSDAHLDIYLNLEDYKDITFPNIVIQILLELFRRLEVQVRTNIPWYRRGMKSRRTLKQIKKVSNELHDYLHEPDEETQEISEMHSSGRELSASLNAAKSSGSAKAIRDSKREVKRQLPKNKLGFLRIELSVYKALVLSITRLLSSRPIFLVMDDFYFVPKSIQPDLIDYFHRLTKGTDLFLKIATIKHRSKLYRKGGEQYTGVELGHDVYEVDMDYTLDDFDELQAFMRQILLNAIEKSSAKVSLDDIFAGEGFPQLCLASGGVPRDFLSLFVTLTNRTVSSGQPIGKIQVTEAAIGNIGSKIESMKKDSGDDDATLEDLLSRVKRYIYEEKRTNAFLVGKDDLDTDPQSRQAIRELVDLRLVHLVDENTSKAPSDGRRYEAYILDVGLYENPRPRNFTQVEPGQRDEKARKDQLRASPVFPLAKLHEPLPMQPRQLELELSFEP